MKNKKFFETSDFKKLNKQWNQKLKEDGFADIETQEERDSYKVTKQEFKVNHQQIEYFRSCEKYLLSGAIADKLDKFIFELHVQGKTNVEISQLSLVTQGIKGVVPQTVDYRIISILKRAGIKQYVFKGIE